MSKKRNQYSAQLKAKVALEAIRGEKTVAELAAQYEIHPTMINAWKRQWTEGARDLLDSQPRAGNPDEEAQAQIDELYRQIG